VTQQNFAPGAAAAIEESLALFSERCADPMAAIYRLMFQRHPYMAPYFQRDTNNAIKGEMLARTIEAILDFIGPREYSHLMIGTEMVTHEGYDVPREVFVTFFAIIRDAMRETLAGAWSDAFEAAWAKLLDEIHQFADATPRIDVDTAHERTIRERLTAQGAKLG